MNHTDCLQGTEGVSWYYRRIHGKTLDLNRGDTHGCRRSSACPCGTMQNGELAMHYTWMTCGFGASGSWESPCRVRYSIQEFSHVMIVAAMLRQCSDVFGCWHEPAEPRTTCRNHQCSSFRISCSGADTNSHAVHACRSVFTFFEPTNEICVRVPLPRRSVS